MQLQAVMTDTCALCMSCWAEACCVSHTQQCIQCKQVVVQESRLTWPSRFGPSIEADPNVCQEWVRFNVGTNLLGLVSLDVRTLCRWATYSAFNAFCVRLTQCQACKLQVMLQSWHYVQYHHIVAGNSTERLSIEL